MSNHDNRIVNSALISIVALPDFYFSWIPGTEN